MHRVETRPLATPDEAVALVAMPLRAPRRRGRRRPAAPLRAASRPTSTFALTRAARLPTFEVDGMTLLRRLTLVLDDGRVTKVVYPVFPPDRSAQDVVDWLSAG